MKILFGVSSFEVGGTEHHALKAMKALSAAGHEVAIIVSRPVGDLTEEFSSRFRVFTYDIRSLLSLSVLSAQRQIYNVLKEWKPDVVHALDPYSNTLLLSVARVAGVKRIIGSKRWFSYSPRQYKYLNAFSFRFAHLVTANGEHIRKTLVESDGVPAAKADVVWNILDDAMFVVPDAQWLAAKRQAFQIPEGARVVGMVARLDPIKDHETFVRSMALVVRELPDAVGVCVGGGSRLEELRRVAVELGVSDCVRFVGNQENIPNLNWLFDVGVLTSLSEGSPNSVLEAMAAGCPVVASAVGGLLDITTFGHPALLSTPGDEKSFAAQILQFLRNAPESREVRLKRSHAIRQRFSPAEFVRKSEQIYRAQVA